MSYELISCIHKYSYKSAIATVLGRSGLLIFDDNKSLEKSLIDKEKPLNFYFFFVLRNETEHSEKSESTMQC